MIELKQVTVQNFDDVIGLTVAERQTEFVATNVESLAQAYVQPDCYPYAVYAGDRPVGFVMYCLDPDDNEWWLYRLMVDKAHQGKGYGKAALKLTLEEIQRKTPGARVFLGVEPENQGAQSLYEAFGFRPDGRIMGNELIMVMDGRGAV